MHQLYLRPSMISSSASGPGRAARYARRLSFAARSASGRWEPSGAGAWSAR